MCCYWQRFLPAVRKDWGGDGRSGEFLLLGKILHHGVRDTHPVLGAKLPQETGLTKEACAKVLAVLGILLKPSGFM